ncbi:hypothetical protein EDF70_106136 [Neorhizobium sp. JUb45]|nr:hypothetical protein EDF70_106136 [Neorhizobium sp. JUb45]
MKDFITWAVLLVCAGLTIASITLHVVEFQMKRESPSSY